MFSDPMFGQMFSDPSSPVAETDPFADNGIPDELFLASGMMNPDIYRLRRAQKMESLMQMAKGGGVQPNLLTGAIEPAATQPNQGSFARPNRQPMAAQQVMASLLDPFGLAPAEPRQNLLFPNEFAERRPRLASALEGAVLGAALTKPSETIGEGISNVAQALLGIPQAKRTAQMQDMLAPFGLAKEMAGLRQMEDQHQAAVDTSDLRQAQADFYRYRATQPIKPTDTTITLSPEQAKEIGLPQLANQEVKLSEVSTFFKETRPDTQVVESDGRVRLVSKRDGTVVKDLGRVTYKPNAPTTPKRGTPAQRAAAARRKNQAIEEANRLFRQPKTKEGYRNPYHGDTAERDARIKAAEDTYREEMQELEGDESFTYDPDTNVLSPKTPSGKKPVQSGERPQVTIKPSGEIVVR